MARSIHGSLAALRARGLILPPRAVEETLEKSPRTEPRRAAASPSHVAPSRKVEVLGLNGLKLRVEKGTELIVPGEWAGHLFYVVRGCVRCVQHLSGGRRCVIGFSLAGDVFGFEPVGLHEQGAEAVVTSELVMVSADDLVEAAFAATPSGRWLRGALARELTDGRARQVRVTHQTPAERLESFLLEMVERLGGFEARDIEIPMPVADIADHLGLSLETINRLLAELWHRGVLDWEPPKIAIPYPDKLLEAPGH